MSEDIRINYKKNIYKGVRILEVYKDIPVGFHRVNKIPLDDSLIINNGTKGLFDYIDNRTAYLGQRLLVRYKDKQDRLLYEVNVILKSSNNNLIPMIEWPIGFEPIIKTYDGNKYIMIYYYNNGSIYTDKIYIKLDDPKSWSMILLAGIFAGDNMSIDYLLETKDNNYLFTQNDISLYSKEYNDNILDAIYDIDNSKYYKITSNMNIGIMPKVNETPLTKLWVKANDYCDLLKR